MRKKSQPIQKSKIGYKILYCVSVAAILVLWAYAFRSYFKEYESLHPEITWAMPWVQIDVIESEGVFLWNEQTLRAPRSGVVRYPGGSGPARVAKGAVVARIVSGPSAYDVRAPQEGYFVAGLDGQEENWKYSSLWPGENEPPKPPSVEMIKDGESVKNGSPIGKLIHQPQDLRFIGYADMTANLEKNLASNGVMVKMDTLDTPSQARVRVYEGVGHRVKMYLSMPWFPPEAALSRGYKLIIEAGSVSGVSIPESSVVTRNGVRGAYVLKGADAVFTKIGGRFIGGSKFLVTEGMKLGDAVIVNGHSAREGRVKLW
ncbi:MAG: efflux RND transporter periplasmic adaptor subunit [Synergistaceae bacterium]|nr:efflux RND transporter periplasmic adaptor subunit [Synergistaceae bacterium]